ncbi:acetyl-CoA acetyltransferase [Nocardioides sp. Soil777]|uniref:acetyl-CoA C-acetyltransferase n=1 Tax=Nocardioides sp. Soil777 TaxID=1736409 RepID=UPI0007037A20|nr:acetyl-CoA C-acetyltransferase [Nocardioides sp. Soil777]KRF00983.1 acetyl-CoA acetyltransferase [Nocardioides sp. Soil777]
MSNAYIVAAVRTPVGRRGGGLAAVHPADLGAHVLRELMDRSGVAPDLVDDVILGCLDNVGPQTGCIARTAWLAAGLPTHVPGVTIDRQCGSSQQAVHFAAQAVMSGTADFVVAGGVQNMSMIPMGTSQRVGAEMGLGEDPFTSSVGWFERYGDQPVNQFHGAEAIAERWSISREDMEQLALESHRRAVRAIDAGLFEDEIVAWGDLSVDEGPRRDSSLEVMAGLRTLRPGGRLTAATSSQISDAASAVLVAGDRAVEEHVLQPLARVHHLTVVGSDPHLMLTGPIAATRRALERTGLSLDDIGVIEVNEAFASVVLAWARELDADMAKVNVNGGAISLGHPIGASGTRLMTSMIGEMRRSGSRYGLQVMCEGGGQANATVLELV